MSTNKKVKKTKEAIIKKENQDLPNIPASSEKINSEETAKKEIKESSKINKEGETDNTEKNSGN